jgi:hypothetical protein
MRKGPFGQMDAPVTSGMDMCVQQWRQALQQGEQVNQETVMGWAHAAVIIEVPTSVQQHIVNGTQSNA